MLVVGNSSAEQTTPLLLPTILGDKSSATRQHRVLQNDTSSAQGLAGSIHAEGPLSAKGDLTLINITNISLSTTSSESKSIPAIKVEKKGITTASSSSPLLKSIASCFKKNITKKILALPIFFPPDVFLSETLDKKTCFNLTLVDFSKQKQKEKKTLNEHTESDGTAHRIHSYNAHEIIESGNFFQWDKSQHILIYGRAGVGKTSLCKQFAYQWAQGQLWPHIKYLFVISLRNLKTSRYVKENDQTDDSLLIKILTQECIDSAPFSGATSLINSALGHLNEEAVFILDGYDEYQLTDKEDVGLKRVVDKLFSFKNIIITSRPHAISNKEIHIDQTLEVIGYDQQEIVNYINYFFKNSEDKSQKLIHFLQQSPNILSMCYVPIHLELICMIWDKDPIKTSSITMTELYQKIIDYKFDYQEREKEYKDIDAKPLSDPIKENIKKILEQVAFLAWTNSPNKIQLSIEPALMEKAIREIDDKITLKQMSDTGFLTFLEGGPLTHASSYFIHPTFQEFFVASYITRQLLTSSGHVSYKEAIDIIKNNICHPNYEVIWWFVAGVLKKSGNQTALIKFFNQILHTENDLVGVYGLLLAVRCFDECEAEVSSEINEKIILKLKIVIQNIFAAKKNSEWLPDILENIIPILRISSHVFLNQHIKNLFIEAISDKEYFVRRAAINTLNQIAIADEEIINALKNVIENAKEFRLREQAAEYFVKISKIDSSIINVFLNQSFNYDTDSDEENGFHSASAKFFAKTAPATEINKAIYTALDSNETAILQSVGLIIGKLDKVPTEIIDKLLSICNKLIQKKERELKTDIIGSGLFYALCRHINNDQKIIDFFLSILESKSKIDKFELKEAVSVTELNEEQLWNILIKNDYIDRNGNINIAMGSLIEKSSLKVNSQCFEKQYNVLKKQLSELLKELSIYMKSDSDYTLLNHLIGTEAPFSPSLAQVHLQKISHKLKKITFPPDNSTDSKLVKNNEEFIRDCEQQFILLQQLQQKEEDFYKKLNFSLMALFFNFIMKVSLLKIIPYAVAPDSRVLEKIRSILNGKGSDDLKFFAVHALKRLINHDEKFIDTLLAIVKEENSHVNLKRIAIETLGETSVEEKKCEIKNILLEQNKLINSHDITSAISVALAKTTNQNLIIAKGMFALLKKRSIRNVDSLPQFIKSCIQHLQDRTDILFDYDRKKYHEALSQIDLTPHLGDINYKKLILKLNIYTRKPALYGYGQHINIFQNTPFISLFNYYQNTNDLSYLMAIYNKAAHENVAIHLIQAESAEEKSQLCFYEAGKAVKVPLSSKGKEKLLVDFKKLDDFINNYVPALISTPEEMLTETKEPVSVKKSEMKRETKNQEKKGEEYHSPKDFGSYLIYKKLSDQSIKIELKHEHPDCKDPYQVLFQALAHCDKNIKNIDLSGNQLDDLSVLCISQFLLNSSYELQTVNLNHNLITAEGLETILSGLAKNPSIASLLLSHNQIAFESHFCQKIVEPLIQQARLKKLDLSMNFVYPGEMLEKKGVRGIHFKIVRDKIRPEHKIEEEKEYYCQLLFKQSPIIISSYLTPAVKSILAPDKMVDKDCAIISLCAFKTTLPPIGEHAFLSIESIHDSGQRFIIMGDLFAVGNEVYVQIIHCSPTEYISRTQGGERIHSRIATVGKTEMNTLINEMVKSRRHEDFYRYSLFPSSRKGIYNCYQWAAKILRIIDIVVDPNSIPSIAVGGQSKCQTVSRCIIS